jgi:hypothetical protein
MKEVIIGAVVLAYVIPFAYILIADFVDVWKRLSKVMSLRVKPAVILITKFIID